MVMKKMDPLRLLLLLLRVLDRAWTVMSWWWWLLLMLGWG
jgi:hypothetical protein